MQSVPNFIGFEKCFNASTKRADYMGGQMKNVSKLWIWIAPADAARCDSAPANMDSLSSHWHWTLPTISLQKNLYFLHLLQSWIFKYLNTFATDISFKAWILYHLTDTINHYFFAKIKKFYILVFGRIPDIQIFKVLQIFHSNCGQQGPWFSFCLFILNLPKITTRI